MQQNMKEFNHKFPTQLFLDATPSIEIDDKAFIVVENKNKQFVLIILKHAWHKSCVLVSHHFHSEQRKKRETIITHQIF